MTVYLIKHPGDNAVKIGYTDGDPMRRLRSMQTGSASLLELVATIPDAPLQVEKDLHHQFNHLRIRHNGEWFTDDPSIHAAFERYGSHSFRMQVQHRLEGIAALLAGAHPDNLDLTVDDLVAVIESIRKCVEAPFCKCVVAPPTDSIPESFPEIPGAEAIIKLTIDSSAKHLKALVEFGNDHSRFEFSTLVVLYRQMCSAISDREMYSGDFYSLSDKAWLLYTAATRLLPPRAEHREVCHGRPLLLQRAAETVALSNTGTN